MKFSFCLFNYFYVEFFSCFPSQACKRYRIFLIKLRDNHWSVERSLSKQNKKCRENNMNYSILYKKRSHKYLQYYCQKQKLLYKWTMFDCFALRSKYLLANTYGWCWVRSLVACFISLASFFLSSSFSICWCSFFRIFPFCYQRSGFR